jgi:hypothetical protein
MYKGVKTTRQLGNNEPVTYYEKALDRHGVGLNIGDKVRVVFHTDERQRDLRGFVLFLVGIFERDLMLSQGMEGFPYFYCWPNNVEKV